MREANERAKEMRAQAAARLRNRRLNEEGGAASDGFAAGDPEEDEVCSEVGGYNPLCGGGAPFVSGLTM